MKTSQIALPLLLLLSLSAAAEEFTTIPVALNPKMYRPLGTGYNSRTQTLKGFCVDNVPDKLPHPEPVRVMQEGSLNLSLSRDEKEIASSLGVTASGRYKTGLSSTSAAASFLKTSKSNAFSLSYTYVAESKFKQVLDPTREFPIRPLPGFAKAVKNGPEFFSLCGDQYVRALNYTTSLMINITTSFISKAEKEKFEASAAFKSKAVEVSGEAKNETSKYNKSNKMTVQVIQLGGTAGKLGQILCPKNAEGKPDPDCDKNSRVVVDCAFGEIDKCTDLLANAVKYANSSGIGNFSEQIDNKETFVVSTMETLPYLNLGDPFPKPTSVAEEKKFAGMRSSALDLFDNEYKLYVFAEQLYKSTAPRLSSRQKSEAERLRSVHLALLDVASDLVTVCHEFDYKACEKSMGEFKVQVEEKKTKDSKLTPYEEILSLTVPESMIQFCDIADDDHAAIRDTMNVLVEYASDRGMPDPTKTGDRCANIAGWFEQQKSLDFSPLPDKDPSKPPKVYKIEDLTPISSLQTLDELNLSGHKIRSIDELGKMVNLKRLILDDNLIQDISPLSKMTALESLRIRNNKIKTKSMASLGVLDPSKPNNDATKVGHLTSIDARGNEEELACPLSEPTSCKLLSFARYADISSANTTCDQIRGHRGVALNENQLLVAGGKTATESATAKIQIITNRGCTTSPQNLIVGRAGHSMTLTAQGVMVVGGGSSTIEIIDPRTMQSRQLNAKLAESVSDHTATLLPDGRLLIVGGSIDGQIYGKPTGISDLVQTIDRDGKVEILGTLSGPRTQHTATLLPDGTVLIVGGYSTNKMAAIVEIINPNSVDPKGRITMVAENLPIGRAQHSAVLLTNNHVMIFGGRKWLQTAESITVPEIVDFDIATRKFRVLEEQMSPARYGMESIATADGRALLIGGIEGSQIEPSLGIPFIKASADIQVYDPKSEGLYQVGKMLNKRIGFTATAMSSNRILIFGGEPQKQATGAATALTTATELLIYKN